MFWCSNVILFSPFRPGNYTVALQDIARPDVSYKSRSFLLSSSWPNNDPAFFECFAITYLAHSHSLTRSMDQLMTSKDFDEALAFSYAMKEKVAREQFSNLFNSKYKGANKIKTKIGDIFGLAL
jgi:hypothetical protein